MNFTNKEFDNFKRDLEKALRDIEEKYELEIKCGRISYSQFEFDMKLTATKNSDTFNGEQKIFEQNCMFYGFEKSDYKRRLTLQGDEFELVGFNDRSPKNNCSIKMVSTGKLYKTNSETVKSCFKKFA